MFCGVPPVGELTSAPAVKALVEIIAARLVRVALDDAGSLPLMAPLSVFTAAMSALTDAPAGAPTRA
jgi:hypothetical protein